MSSESTLMSVPARSSPPKPTHPGETSPRPNDDTTTGEGEVMELVHEMTLPRACDAGDDRSVTPAGVRHGALPARGDDPCVQPRATTAPWPTVRPTRTERSKRSISSTQRSSPPHREGRRSGAATSQTRLEVLDHAVTAEAAAHLEADSLFSDIAPTQPRGLPQPRRVRTARREYGRLSRQIHRALDILHLRSRRRRRRAPTARRRPSRMAPLHQGRESDLIYEAYFDAFNRDIAEELGGHPGPARRLNLRAHT